MAGAKSNSTTGVPKTKKIIRLPVKPSSGSVDMARARMIEASAASRAISDQSSARGRGRLSIKVPTSSTTSTTGSRKQPKIEAAISGGSPAVSAVRAKTIEQTRPTSVRPRATPTKASTRGLGRISLLTKRHLGATASPLV